MARPITGATVSTAMSAGRVRLVVCVPTRTVRRDRPMTSRSTVVLRRRHRLQVRWVHAGADPAQVVDLKPIRNRANNKLVRDPVGAPSAKLRSAPENPVALVLRAGPYPAGRVAGALVDSGPEALLDAVGQRSLAHTGTSEIGEFRQAPGVPARGGRYVSGMSGEEDLSWIPATCPNGHELGAGKTSLSWVFCTCRQPAAAGHHIAYCRVNGCHVPTLPPGCPGLQNQR